MATPRWSISAWPAASPSPARRREATAAEVTDPGTVLGTVRYMSPEQARGETAGSASDIFSLGIVLYELATGQHPFPADSHVGVLHAIVSQTPAAALAAEPGDPRGAGRP